MTTTDVTKPETVFGRLPRFIGVARAARDRGVSPMTLYREIAEGRFPALRLGTRLVVPVEDNVPSARVRPRNVAVPEAARALDVSPATLYRLIRDRVFPATRYRRRIVVAAAAIEQMAAAAIVTRTEIDPADWVDRADRVE